MRNNLPEKLPIFMQDIFQYAHDGAKTIIKHGWLEEPPQLEQKKNYRKDE
ncbi:MAG: DUF3231 family protein [Heyndrickxia sp.]